MEGSPLKNKNTSKVIDSLHSQIDELKSELDVLRLSNADYKKKSLILATKNESFVDQLANCKHENDMINALLKRKERRIADLEDQYNDLSSTSETMKLANKNLKIRCDNLQDLSASSTAEYERLKIAYDALIASQNEYKRHYQSEFVTLTNQFETHKTDTARHMAELLSKLTSNDKDVDTMLDSLNNKRKVMDNLYVNKNKAVLELLVALAKTTKLHGEELRVLIEENISTVKLLRDKYPELLDQIPNHEEISVDLDDLLSESNDTLSTIDFDAPAEDARPQRTMSRRRKNKRNLMRVVLPDPAELAEKESPMLPRQRANVSAASTARASSRTSSESSNVGRGRGNRISLNLNQTISQNAQQNQFGGNGGTQNGTSAKYKRRLFYGGSSNFNSGNGERRQLRKTSTEV